MGHHHYRKYDIGSRSLESGGKCRDPCWNRLLACKSADDRSGSVHAADRFLAGRSSGHCGRKFHAADFRGECTRRAYSHGDAYREHRLAC